MISLRKVIRLLVGLGNDNSCQNFKVQWQMIYINTYISDIDELVEAYIIFDNSLEVSLRQFVWSRSQGVVAFLDCTN